MTIREDMYERQQHPLKDVGINFLNHNSFEYTYARGSPFADGCPDMHLHRMLCPVDVCEQCRGSLLKISYRDKEISMLKG